MTKREKMLKECLVETRNIALRALSGDAKAKSFLAAQSNIVTKGEILSFVTAMNLSIESVVSHSRKETAPLYESKWISPEWIGANN
jgi:hypothetical protein